MPLEIAQILSRSSAAKHGIKAGETILTINGNPIRDFLDLQFYSSQPELLIKLEDKGGNQREVQVTREMNRALGIEPVAYECRRCQNRCVFCFIDQMPPGLRDSLYVKDDDYVYSFVFGNYISLTNLSENDLRRIVTQRISPLYISVHTTDSSLRRKMMGYRRDFNILQALKTLVKHRIEMNIQIVCVPGYNDGEELSRSLRDLTELGEQVTSIGIVPVGLTAYRDGLPELRAFDQALALDCLQRIDAIRRELDVPNIYAADEFYVLADLPIPKASYYNDFPQIENGIGMLRLLKSKFNGKKARFLKELRKHPADYVMLTGKSAFGEISRIAEYLNSKLESQKIRVLQIENRFCGPQISVAGLLSFSDLKDQLVLETNEIPILSSAMFNYENKTLDGASPIDMKELWQRDLLIVDQFFEDWDWQ